MDNRFLLLLALLGAATFSLTACPTSDDDDSVSDDDDATSDDDDATGDDDDATGDDDDSAGDDDDSAGDDDDATGGDFSILGSFDDGFGGAHAINERAWLSWGETSSSRYDIAQHDEQGWVIAQNASTNEYNPDLWSRFDFFEDAGQAYYCQTAYNADTEEAALATAPADRGDLVAGCGGFGWSTLTASSAHIAIAGVFADEYYGDNTITDNAWTVVNGEDIARFAITQFDNAGGYAIAQNGSENSFNADLWSRFDFALVGGDWFSCTTAYDAADEATALATAAADATDPSTTGCGGFPWTNLTP